jgi:hypothetical protein
MGTMRKMFAGVLLALSATLTGQAQHQGHQQGKPVPDAIKHKGHH